MERRGATCQNPSSGQAGSASAQAASALSSCTTVRASWYDEPADRNRGDARRRAELCGEYRIFGF
jgi:hypothetical protein